MLGKMAMQQPILRYFKYDHLPDILQDVSKPFHDLAMQMAEDIPACEELDHGLRKLLESKDCIVRAALSHLAEREKNG